MKVLYEANNIMLYSVNWFVNEVEMLVYVYEHVLMLYSL